MVKKVLISAMIWSISTVLTVTLYFVMLATVILCPFDKKRKIAHAQCFWWSDAIIAMNPLWTIRVAGLENIDKRRTYVIVSNHQSLADIAVLYQLKCQFKWVAKDGLFTVPFVGWSLSLARHIRLYRGKFFSIKKVYREAAEWLRGGISVLFFPEGTRSETGQMRDFQNGAFKLAIKEKVPVLPVSLDGIGGAIPKGTWLFNAKVDCSLRVYPAVETAGFEARDYEKLKELVRAEMASQRR